MQNFAEFINEGSQDRLIGILSRECMDAIKKGQHQMTSFMGLFGKTVRFEFNWELLS